MNSNKRNRSHFHTLPALDNQQIDSFFQNWVQIPNYHPCICKDQLKHLKPQPITCIINSQNTNYKGNERHWTCVYSDNNYIVIFNSYGFLIDDAILEYCKKVSKIYNLQIITEDTQLQREDSDSCGWFCIFIIMKLLKGETFAQAIKHFHPIKRDTDSNNYNEKYLKNYFKPLKNLIIRKT